MNLDYGLYHVNTNHGDWTSEVADYCTFAMVNPGLSRIRTAIHNGLQAVVNMAGYANRENWRNDTYEYFMRLNNERKLQSPMTHLPYHWHLSSSILAFYVYDEPYHRGMSYHDFNRWCRVLSRYIDELFLTFDMVPELWATFAYPSIKEDMKIPKFLDRVSITPRYGVWTLEDMKYKINILRKRMHDHQSIVLTADGFNREEVPSRNTQRLKANIFRDYFRYARDTKDITGLWTFLYPSFSKGCGVRGMPIVQRMVERIGRRIKK